LVTELERAVRGAGQGKRETNLGFVARGDAGLEGVAEAPHHAQPGVVLDQPAKKPSQIQQRKEHEKFRRKDETFTRISGRRWEEASPTLR